MSQKSITNRSTVKSGYNSKVIKLLLTIVLVSAIVAAAAFYYKNSNSVSPADISGTYQVKPGNLKISVTENGDIRALNSKEITSKVEGITTIISIVDEGTIITPKDVNDGKVLVELDSSRIKEKLTTQEISYLSADASLTEARESLDIQKKQNESDIEAGKLAVRFALIDFRKYLGDYVAHRFLADLKTQTVDPDRILTLIDDPNLGGSALQQLRQLQDSITLAEMRYARAVDKLEGTKELFEQKYVAEIELKGDELEKQSLNVQVQQAKTALKLFKLYEFPKETERLICDYFEAQRKLDQIYASARSKLAQAQAALGSKKATFRLQKEQFEKYQDQLEACLIKAPAPGEVVYASSTERRGRRSSPEPIEVGAEIRERQRIISIPDTSIMKVEIKIHETWINKIGLGQPAIIRVAAFPDQQFTGKVIRKSPLADPENWMNPDLKVYSTDVSIDGIYDYLKTGMTAKVEVVIDELENIISVPIQSVVNYQGKKVCYVVRKAKVQRTQVQTGAFNDTFVEIISGINQGDFVMLNPPRYLDTDSEIASSETGKITRNSKQTESSKRRSKSESRREGQSSSQRAKGPDSKKQKPSDSRGK